MSKTTKIIAALGVVAGLGVAALPAFTYASEAVDGYVEVDVRVEDAIAMTIVGNNDDSEYYGTEASVSYDAVTPEEDQVGNPQNPHDLGWYERSGDGETIPYSYTLSNDSTVDGNKTYYARTATPGSYASVDTFSPSGAAGSTIDTHPTPATAVEGTSSSYISLLPNAVKIGNSENNFRSTITVYTNNASGYDLTLIDEDDDNDLVKESDVTIPATAATTLSAGTAAWGYRVSGDTDWLAVPEEGDTAATIDTLGTKTTGGRQVIVEYGVATAADQATGLYSDTIIYTATTK